MRNWNKALKMFNQTEHDGELHIYKDGETIIKKGKVCILMQGNDAGYVFKEDL